MIGKTGDEQSRSELPADNLVFFLVFGFGFFGVIFLREPTRMVFLWVKR